MGHKRIGFSSLIAKNAEKYKKEVGGRERN